MSRGLPSAASAERGASWCIIANSRTEVLVENRILERMTGKTGKIQVDDKPTNRPSDRAGIRIST
jgi:hypothetical protein